MDPDQLQGLVMFLGLAENLLGSEIIPGAKKLLHLELGLTPEDVADLDEGYVQLSTAREKLKARRAEIAATGGQ